MSLELPKHIGGWQIDRSLTELDSQPKTIQYRRSFGGNRYTVYIEDQGDGTYGGALIEDTPQPHEGKIATIRDFTTLEDAFEEAKEQWLTDTSSIE